MSSLQPIHNEAIVSRLSFDPFESRDRRTYSDLRRPSCQHRGISIGPRGERDDPGGQKLSTSASRLAASRRFFLRFGAQEEVPSGLPEMLTIDKSLRSNH